MTTEPVYFIGGTFSSGSSGWTIAIITALTTAALTFGVGLLHEDHKRHRDMKGLASALLAEITSLLQLLDELKIETKYRDLKEKMEKALREGQPCPGSPHDALSFPPTVYEKCADRVGILGADIAADVVTFYNSVYGFRTAVRLALNADQSLVSRIEVIRVLLQMLADQHPKAAVLRDKLKALGGQNWPAALRRRWAN